MSKYFVDKKYFFLSFLTLFSHILNFFSLSFSPSILHLFSDPCVCLSVCLSDISLSHASFLPSLFFSPHPSLFLSLNPYDFSICQQVYSCDFWLFMHLFIRHSSFLPFIVLSLPCSTIPMFAHVRQRWRKIYYGLCIGGGFRTMYEIAHLHHVPMQYRNLAGLLEIFKDKLVG